MERVASTVQMCRCELVGETQKRFIQMVFLLVFCATMYFDPFKLAESCKSRISRFAVFFSIHESSQELTVATLPSIIAFRV